MSEKELMFMTTAALRELARDLVRRLSDEEVRRLLDEVVRDRSKAS